MSKYRQQGFTIIELLLVIVVIAILATLTYVAYTTISSRALSSALQSDLKNASTKLETLKIENGTDTYPLGPTLPSSITSSDGTTLQYASNGQTYCLTATTSKSDTLQYTLSNNNRTPQQGTCSGHADATGAVPPQYLQTITSTNCPTTRTLAVDARDNHTYYIQKLGEGANARCWMLTNLAYAGGTSNGGTNTYNDTIPTGDGTNGTLHGPDNSGSTTYTLAKYYTHAGANPTTNPAQPSTDTTGGGTGANRQYGYLYNFCAANGGQTGNGACSSSSSTAVNQAISICPAGWRLPTGTATTGDFTLLNNTVNSGLTNTDAGLRSEWLAQRSGNWTSGFLNQSSYGRYWSASQTSATNARDLYFTSSNVNPSDVGNKNFGRAVRCVAA